MAGIGGPCRTDFTHSRLAPMPNPQLETPRARPAWFTPLFSIIGAALLLGQTLAAAAEVDIKITDRNGAAVPNAVIALYGNAVSAPASTAVKAVMDQRKLQFAPHVLAIQRGTAVRFPNSDDIRHQVYSFSSAKRFNLPLYHGVPAEPVVFEEAGEVALGCNIHDRMIGYIYVVDTPWFASTDANGAATLANVPDGTYIAKLWYPGLSAAALIINPGLPVSAHSAATLTSNQAERENLPTPAATDTPKTRGWGERRGDK